MIESPGAAHNRYKYKHKHKHKHKAAGRPTRPGRGSSGMAGSVHFAVESQIHRHGRRRRWRQKRRTSGETETERERLGWVWMAFLREAKPEVGRWTLTLEVQGSLRTGTYLM